MPIVATPQYGLLNGLAEGLKQGLLTYQTTKNVQHQQQLQDVAAGVQRDDNGNLQLNPLEQQKRQLQQLSTQRQLGEETAGSPESNSYLQTVRGIWDSSHSDKTYKGPKGDQIFPEGMSAAQAKEHMGLIGKDVTGEYGMLRSLYNPIATVKQEQVNTTKDNQTSSAVDKVTNDAQLKNHTQRIQGANRILDQLSDAKSGKIVDTNQLLNDVNTEYVALLTGANNPALGKQERTEYTTMSGNLAALMQKIKATPESVNSPEILQQLETQVKGLRGNYQGQVANRAKLLKREYKHNPDATKAQQDKIDEMVNQFGTPGQDQPSDFDASVKRLQELRAKKASGG